MPDNVAPISIDPDKISEVIVNLTGNAVKFTPFYSNITVCLRDFDNRVEISVTDTGRGIDKDDLEKIFSKMYLLEKRKEPSLIGGMGLGLAISKEIVEMHGGKISAESVIGKGSTFTFTIPRFSEDDILLEHLRDLIKNDKSFSLIVFDITKGSLSRLPSLTGKELCDLMESAVKAAANYIRESAIKTGCFRGRYIVIAAMAGSKREADLLVQNIKKLLDKEEFKAHNINVKIEFEYFLTSFPEDGKTPVELLNNLNKGLVL